MHMQRSSSSLDSRWRSVVSCSSVGRPQHCAAARTKTGPRGRGRTRTPAHLVLPLLQGLHLGWVANDGPDALSSVVEGCLQAPDCVAQVARLRPSRLAADQQLALCGSARQLKDFLKRSDWPTHSGLSSTNTHQQHWRRPFEGCEHSNAWRGGAAQ
jgi:hypothetical protein